MKILIVDDHAVVRHGYKTLLETMLAGVIVYEAEDSMSCWSSVKKTCFDIIVLDINLQGESGLLLGKRLLDDDPDRKVIFFSMFEDAAILNQAMQTGARGYISKSSNPRTMIDAIREVSIGRKFIEQALAVKLADLLLVNTLDIETILTPREFEIFILIAQQHDKLTIAEKLLISAKTVANIATSIKQKLGLKQIEDVRAIAVERGYVIVNSPYFSS